MIRSYSSLLTWVGLTIAASLALYHTSDRVNALDQQLRSLNAQIESEQESLHVLKAEWVYLANPARIEAEVKGHLDLQPTDTHRVASLRDMGALLPLHDGIEAVPPVEVAEALQAPAPKKVASAPREVPRTKYERVIASLNEGHLNDHMVLQHAAPAPAAPDRIGAMIGALGLNP